MDDLQYIKPEKLNNEINRSFKPCYKWMTFNTVENYAFITTYHISLVLNLVING